MSQQEVLDRFSVSNPSLGHRKDDIPGLLRHYGDNLPPAVGKDLFSLMGGEFATMFWVILVTGVFLLFVGAHDDQTSLLLHVLFSIAMAANPIYVAYITACYKSAYQQLSILSPKIVCLRDGESMQIDVKDLVPGDIVHLRPGDKTPADIRIISCQDLLIDRSMFSGESIPIPATTETTEQDNALRADNMAYYGTFIVGGQGTGIVVHTGGNTVLGGLMQKINAAEDTQGPRLEDFIVFVIIAAMLCGTFWIVGIIVTFQYGFNPKGRALFTLSLVFFNLATSVLTMVRGFYAILLTSLAQKGLLLKNSQITDSMRKVTAVVADLKGVLTVNDIKIVRFWESGEHYAEIPKIARKQLGLVFDESSQAKPDLAVREFVEKTLDVNVIRQENPMIREMFFPESPELVVRARSVEDKPTIIIYGPTSSVLPLCTQAINDDDVVPLSQLQKKLDAALESSAAIGMETYALAFKEVENDNFSVKDCTFSCLIDFSDAPKESAKMFYKLLKTYRKKLYVTTSEELTPALSLCRMFEHSLDISNHELASNKLSLMQSLKDAETVTLNDSEFTALKKRPQMLELIKRSSFLLYGLKTHEIQRKLIKFLQKQKKTVAYLGGNDSDSDLLKLADVGVVCCAQACEMVKESGDVVLTNDDLSVISSGLLQSRGITWMLWESFLGMVSIPCMTLFVLSFMFQFQINTLGILVLITDFGLPGSALYWGARIWSKNPVYLGALSGIQASVACTCAGLFTFFHWMADKTTIEQAQTGYLMSVLISQWIYYACVTFKFYCEDWDIQLHVGIHIGMGAKVFIFICLVLFAGHLGFTFAMLEHFVLPSLNYFGCIQGMHFAFKWIFS